MSRDIGDRSDHICNGTWCCRAWTRASGCRGSARRESDQAGCRAVRRGRRPVRIPGHDWAGGSGNVSTPRNLLNQVRLRVRQMATVSEMLSVAPPFAQK